jgi:hypothetical protein
VSENIEKEEVYKEKEEELICIIIIIKMYPVQAAIV